MSMFERPAVMITAIIGGTLVMLCALGAIVFLAAHGKATDAIGILVLGVLGVLWGKIRKIETQTDGTQTKLIDHTISQATQHNGEHVDA